MFREHRAMPEVEFAVLLNLLTNWPRALYKAQRLQGWT